MVDVRHNLVHLCETRRLVLEDPCLVAKVQQVLVMVAWMCAGMCQHGLVGSTELHACKTKALTDGLGVDHGVTGVQELALVHWVNAWWQEDDVGR